MKPLRLMLALVVACTTVLAADAAHAAPGSIDGTVTVDGAVASGVTVAAFDVSNQLVGSDVTDGSGAYSIAGLDPADYRVRFDPGPGIGIEWYIDQYSWTTATPVTVPDGGAVAGIDGQLSTLTGSPGTITGTVTNSSTGDPIGGICVTAYTEFGSVVAGSDTSDSGGVYSIGVIETGQQVDFFKVEFVDCGIGVRLTEWYDDERNYEEATPVAVTRGQTTTGIDGPLDGAGEIQGMVRYQGGGQPDEYCINLFDATSGATFPLLADLESATAVGSPTYVVSGIVPGTYYLQAAPCSSGNLVPGWYGSIDGSFEDALGLVIGSDETFTGVDITTYRGNSAFTVLSTGQSATTDTGNGATAGDPLVSTLAIVGPGSFEDYVLVVEPATPRGPTPSELVPFGFETEIDVPPLPAGVTYAATFEIDAGVVPGGHDRLSLAVGYDGLLVPDCTGPDPVLPCVMSRTVQGDTDVVISVAGETSGIFSFGTPAGGVIRGSVTADVGGAALAGICVFGDVAGSTAAAVTTAVGTYALGLGLAGDVKVSFQDCADPVSPAYATEWYDNVPDAGAATTVAVSGGAIVSGIDASLAPAASIRGVVTDGSTGLPFVGPDQAPGVEGLCANAVAGGYRVGPPAWVQADGTYRLVGLSAGTFTVLVGPCGNEPAPGSYVPTWYDAAAGSVQPADAAGVVVTTGGETAGIDLTVDEGVSAHLLDAEAGEAVVLDLAAGIGVTLSHPSGGYLAAIVAPGSSGGGFLGLDVTLIHHNGGPGTPASATFTVPAASIPAGAAPFHLDPYFDGTTVVPCVVAGADPCSSAKYLSSGGHAVAVLAGAPGTWTFAYDVPPVLPGPWTDSFVGDFDGDGLDDLALYTESDGTWWVHRSSSYDFVPEWWATFSTTTGWSPQLVGDFTGDGLDDIVSYHEGTGRWWVNRSTGSSFVLEWWATFSTTSGWDPQLVGDFTGDGKDDVVSYHEGTGRWWVNRSTGSTFGLELWTTFGTKSGWGPQLVGDFTGDGKDDVVSYYEGLGRWWVNVSTGSTFVQGLWSTYATTSGWHPYLVGDFTGDGKDDLATYYEGLGRWWVNAAATDTFELSLWTTFGTPSGWTIRVAGDFTGDGADDIANYHPGTGRWWISESGDNTFDTRLWFEPRS